MQSESEKKGVKPKEEKSKTKISLDEEISKVVIKSIEQECLNRVFDRLCDLGKHTFNPHRKRKIFWRRLSSQTLPTSDRKEGQRKENEN